MSCECGSGEDARVAHTLTCARQLTRAEVAGIPNMINLRIISNVLYFIGRAIAKEDTLEALTSRADMYAERSAWVNANADKIVESLTKKMEAKLGADFE